LTLNFSEYKAQTRKDIENEDKKKEDDATPEE
jgi:hypothetical protein